MLSAWIWTWSQLLLRACIHVDVAQGTPALYLLFRFCNGIVLPDVVTLFHRHQLHVLFHGHHLHVLCAQVLCGHVLCG